MITLSITSHKGGAGKSTTAYWLAHHLSRQHGQQVLLIDLDPQGNLSRRYGYGTKPGEMLAGPTIADVLRKRQSLAEASRPGPAGIHIIPADLRLADAGAYLTSEPFGHNALRNALRKTQEADGWILIDCAPAADILVFNALVASNYYITPAAPDEDHLSGCYTINSLSTRVHIELGTGPAYLGSIATQVNKQTIKHQANLGRLPLPLLGEVPLRQGLNAEIDISEAYRGIVEKLVEAAKRDKEESIA